MAGITDEFSFAYMKEAFVATLLEMARNADDFSESGGDNDGDDDGSDPLDKYELWRVFKAQVKILRNEMGGDEAPGNGTTAGPASGAYEGYSSAQVGFQEITPLLDAMKLQKGATQPQGEAVSSSAMHTGESHDVCAKGRLAEGNSSVLSPIHSFAPLATRKVGRLSQGAWEWGL